MTSALADLGVWRGGGTPTKTNLRYWGSGTIPWMSPKDMKRPVLVSAEDYITPAAISESATRLIPSGSVLVVTRSGILRHSLPVAVNAIPAALNQDLKALTPYCGVDAAYTAWALRAFEQDILHRCAKSGTTVQSIETEKLVRYRIPVAPLPEQRRIVAALEEYLSDLDAAVAGLERSRQKITRLRESILSAALGDDAWPRERLGTLIAAGPDNGLYLPKSAYGSGTPILRIDDYQNFWSRSSGELRRVRTDEVTGARFALRVGDLVINRVNSASHLGKCLVVEHRHLPALFESNMMRMQLTHRAYPHFISLFLRSPIGRATLTANAKWAVNQASINQSDVRDTVVPLPSAAVQQQVAEAVVGQLAVSDRTTVEIDVQLARAARLRQSILKRAFEGRLVPQNPDDEPADVLLDRIRRESARQPQHRRRGRPSRAGA